MKPILEVLIPTHRRPESAAHAIESVLAVQDERIAVRCNSDPYEPLLEKYRTNHRVSYDCFRVSHPDNNNAIKLLLNTDARFCMLLSDEDRINLANSKDFLEYLDNLPNDISVVSCSVFDTVINKYYYRPKDSIAETSMDIDNYVAHDPLSRYMSGLVFRCGSLELLNISSLYKKGTGNAYPHLVVTLHLLKNGRLRFYQPRFVDKGPDVEYGGDGHVHKKKNETSEATSNGNLDLNPNVYGPRARARQFYYIEKISDGFQGDIKKSAFLAQKFLLIRWFLRAISRSSSVVILSPDINLGKEMRSARTEAINADEHSGSVAANLFNMLSYFPIHFLSFFYKIRRNIARARGRAR